MFILGQKAQSNIAAWASWATKFISGICQEAKCLCSQGWEYLAKVFNSWAETTHSVIDFKGLSLTYIEGEALSNMLDLFSLKENPWNVSIDQMSR